MALRRYIYIHVIVGYSFLHPYAIQTISFYFCPCMFIFSMYLPLSLKKSYAFERNYCLQIPLSTEFVSINALTLSQDPLQENNNEDVYMPNSCQLWPMKFLKI